MKSHIRVVASVLAGATLLVTSCTPTPPDQPNCNTTDSIAVIWSSETGTYLRLELWDERGHQATLHTQAQGAEQLDATPIGTRKGYLGTNGNAQHDTSSIVTFDRTACTLATAYITPTGMLASAIGPNGLYASFVTGGPQSEIAHYTTDGTQTTTTGKYQDSSSGLRYRENQLIEFTDSDDAQSRMTLYLHDPITLEKTHQVEINSQLDIPASLTSAAGIEMIGNEVYFSIPVIDLPNGTRDLPKKIGVVDLNTNKASWIPLEHDLPAQIEAYQGKLYISHSLPVPVKDPSDYRYLTRLDPTTKHTETFDLGPHLSSIAFSNNKLYALHYSPEIPPTLEIYNPTTMTKITTHQLPQPDLGNHHYYIAGIGFGQ